MLSANVAEYLSGFDSRLLATSEGRRIMTRLHPRLFALLYLRHHLSGDETQDTISFSEAQLEWYDQMLEWVRPVSRPKEWRRAYVAPRASAKSTTWFLIAPLWAAAHKHTEFVAAFADSASQAEQHLASLKAELETNTLLRLDYPELCKPARRSRGSVVSDNRTMMQSQSGFVFAARGIDSASLGMKVGEKRPQLLILDDVEPPESSYSSYQAERRLATLLQAILPLNEYARVVLVGTVTMSDSIVHQLVRTVTSSEEPAEWIRDEEFQCFYYPAILTNDEGCERSLWPEKWALPYLQANRHTRQFALNMMNSPILGTGEYWEQDDFIYERLPSVSTRVLSVDPAVTTKRTSDQTALAVVSYSASQRRAQVDEVIGVRLKGEPLRQRVLALLARYPDVKLVLWESNQGGEILPHSVLHDMPVPIQLVHQKEKKELRAERLLSFYRRKAVVHAQVFPDFEQQCLSFPRGLHDDLVDAVGTGIDYLAALGKPVAKLRFSVK